MMLTHIVTSSTHETKITLLYEIYLTKVFCYFGVDLSNEESCYIHHIYHSDHFSYLCMGYTFDYQWQTYHKMISEQDIYVYSRKTYVDHLSTDYSDPTCILHNINAAANPKGDERVPPPSNDPMDVNPCASSSNPTYRRAPIVASTITSLKPYLQQIMASIADMDTHLLASLVAIQHEVRLQGAHIDHQTSRIDALYE